MAVATSLLQGLDEEDYLLLLEANKRIQNNGSNKTIPFNIVMSDLGINEKELNAIKA